MYYSYVYPTRQAQHHNERILTVTGVGEIAVQPDVATIQQSVITENLHLATAQQDNANSMTQVIQSLQQLGISDENIQTVTYNIQPRYDYIEGKQVFQGYEVINTISVKVNEFDKIGRVIDISVENGVNQVGQIEFSTSNHQFYEQQALQHALQNAEGKAQAMAESLNIQLDLIPIKITEQAQDQPRPYQTFALSEKATTPIEPGQLLISAVVRVQYQY